MIAALPVIAVCGLVNEESWLLGEDGAPDLDGLEAVGDGYRAASCYASGNEGSVAHQPTMRVECPGGSGIVLPDALWTCWLLFPTGLEKKVGVSVLPLVALAATVRAWRRHEGLKEDEGRRGKSRAAKLTPQSTTKKEPLSDFGPLMRLVF